MTKSTKAQKQRANPESADRVTKKDQLIRLLSAKTGADTKALSSKLGWQQHTTRAALTALRKAGFEIAGEKPSNGGTSKYRIVSGPALEKPSAVTETDHAG